MTERSQGVVLFVAPSFSDPGGCSSHARKLAEGLAERGWTVHVVARLGSGTRLRRFSESRILVTEIPGPSGRRLGGLLFVVLALPLVLMRKRPAAVMAMQVSSPAAVASVAATLFRRPLLIFSTMTGPNGEAAFVRSSRFCRMRRALLNRASTLIAQTDEGAEELRDLLPEAKVTVIPNPIRIPADPPLLTNDHCVAYTGRLVRQKNLSMLLSVWPAVLAQLPDARLTLVGEGLPPDPTEAEIRTLIDSNRALAGSVTITGWVDDVVPYLEGADVYAFPTRFEGLSNSLLEACALGRVVVASDISANRAAVGDSYPLLFSLNRPQELVQMLIASMTDEAMRATARKQVLAQSLRFTFPRVIDEVERLLTTAGTSSTLERIRPDRRA